MFDFFSLVIAIVALIFARKAFNQVAALRARLDAMEAVGCSSESCRRARRRSHCTSEPEQRCDLRAGNRGRSSRMPMPPITSPAAADSAATPTRPRRRPPPLPQRADPGFEERIGTRWVVWVGGLTLALGGFFMVRYSIEAGLLGPGVRTLLGGAFALALLAAGEWTRRKESISRDRRAADRQHPGDPHRRRHRGRVRDRLRRLCAVRFPRARHRVHPARLVALGTLAAALLHGPALAGLGVAAAFVTPILVSSDKPDFWALYIYLAIVTAAAFGAGADPAVALARGHHHRVRAALDLPVPANAGRRWSARMPSMSSPASSSPRCWWCAASCSARPPRKAGSSRSRPARSRPICSARPLIVLTSFHADTAMIVVRAAGGRHLVRRMARAGRHRRGRRGRVARSSSCSWNGRCAAIRTCWCCRAAPLPGIGPHATDGSVSLHLMSAAIFAVGFGVAGFLAQGRSVSAIIPVVWSAAAVFTPLALLIALYARIAHLDRSIPFAILAVMLAAAFGAATEILDQARRPAGTADLDRAVRHRHARRAGAGADLCARKGLAHDRAGADVAGHRVDFDAAADPVPALARRHSRRDRGAAHRLRAAHRRRCGRHHADLQLAAVGLRHSGAVVLGRQHLPAPPRRRRAAARGGSRRRSCSRCCWRSWKSAMPSMAAMSIATTPA